MGNPGTHRLNNGARPPIVDTYQFEGVATKNIAADAVLGKNGGLVAQCDDV